MKWSRRWCRSRRLMATIWLALSCGVLQAADLTFYSYSDSHYGADAGGRQPPKIRSAEVEIIKELVDL